MPLSKRDLWIAGLMLYAGEGRKNWKISSQAVELTNSDPCILRIFIKFLLEVCDIPRDKIKVRVFLYPDIDLGEAERFWAGELNIPIGQFKKSFIKRGYSNPSRVRKSKYGTAHIVVHNAQLYRKILDWLKAVYNCSETI